LALGVIPSVLSSGDSIVIGAGDGTIAELKFPKAKHYQEIMASGVDCRPLLFLLRMAIFLPELINPAFYQVAYKDFSLQSTSTSRDVNDIQFPLGASMYLLLPPIPMSVFGMP
jgi:hypothetical protein